MTLHGIWHRTERKNWPGFNTGRKKGADPEICTIPLDFWEGAGNRPLKGDSNCLGSGHFVCAFHQTLKISVHAFDDDIKAGIARDF